MVEISDYVWESLYIMKDIYDHDDRSVVLDMFSNIEIDGDCMYEIAVNSIGAVFKDTRNYYHEKTEYEVYVFFDPVIEGYWRLCDEYEAKTGVTREDNIFRKEMINAINSALYFPDYSYGMYSYDDTKRKNGCRIALVFGIEFCCHYMVPGGLCEAYEAFETNTKRIKKALAELEKPKIIELPKKKANRKKAA